MRLFGIRAGLASAAPKVNLQWLLLRPGGSCGMERVGCSSDLIRLKWGSVRALIAQCCGGSLPLSLTEPKTFNGSTFKPSTAVTGVDGLNGSGPLPPLTKATSMASPGLLGAA